MLASSRLIQTYLDTYPFHTPNIYPATVPKVDQPTNGGKETKKTHSQRIKKANLDFSHLSATGANQMNTFPVKTIKVTPTAITPSDAATAPTFCQRFISPHARPMRRDTPVARLMIWSRKEVASFTGRWTESRLLSEEWRHGGRMSLYEGEDSGEVERERARAVEL